MATDHVAASQQLVWRNPADRLLLTLLILAAAFQGAFYAPMGVTSDAEKYAALVEWLRGSGTLEGISAAFRHRVGVPLLAAPLPLDAFDALRVVNFASSLLVVALTHVVTRRLGGSTAAAFVAGLWMLFTPALVGWGFRPLTDATATLMLQVSYLLWVTHKPRWLILASCTLGLLVRETNGVALLFVAGNWTVAALRQYGARKPLWPAVLRIAALSASTVLLPYLLRVWMQWQYPLRSTVPWPLSWDRVVMNTERCVTTSLGPVLLSTLLPFVAFVIVDRYAGRKQPWKLDWAHHGMLWALALLIPLLAIGTAYFGVRFTLPLSAFVIPHLCIRGAAWKLWRPASRPVGAADGEPG